MRKTINKIVGIIEDEVYVLEEVFNDGLKGCSGYHMRPLTNHTIYEMKHDTENLRELWKQAVESDNTDLGLDEWCEMVNDEAEQEGRLFATDDNSFRDDFFELVNNLPKEQWKQVMDLTDNTFEVSGCGRCFEKNMKFDIVFDKKLVELINKMED